MTTYLVVGVGKVWGDICLLHGVVPINSIMDNTKLL